MERGKGSQYGKTMALWKCTIEMRNNQEEKERERERKKREKITEAFLRERQRETKAEREIAERNPVQLSCQEKWASFLLSVL